MKSIGNKIAPKDQTESLHFLLLLCRKTQGCYREFGFIETIRRIFRELFHLFNKPDSRLDISPLTEELAIGAAPRSIDALRDLRSLNFTDIIDLRAERKSSDILTWTEGVHVNWIPTYDDWKPKPPDFFRRLSYVLNNILSSDIGKKVLICCGAGEHRSPLAGVLGLVNMGYSLESALSKVQQARPISELLPVYKLSLVHFLKERRSDF